MALQRQHHAGKDRGQRHHRQREVSDVEELAQHLPGIEGRADHVRDGDGGEPRQPPDRAEEVEEHPSDQGQKVHVVAPFA